MSLQGLSSNAPIVPTKVLGDPEELDRHLAMHQNGVFVGPGQLAASAGGAGTAPAEPAGDGPAPVVIPPSISVEGFDGRFIFTQPSIDLVQPADVQLHVKKTILPFFFPY